MKPGRYCDYSVCADVDGKTLWWQRGRWVTNEQRSRKIWASTHAHPQAFRGARRICASALRAGATYIHIQKRIFRNVRWKGQDWFYGEEKACSSHG